MPAGEITIDVSDCNSFKTFLPSLERLPLRGLQFWSIRLILARIVSAFSFSGSFTASSIVAMISLMTPYLDILLEVIEKSMPFERQSVFISVNFLEDMLITHLFFSVMLIRLCLKSLENGRSKFWFGIYCYYYWGWIGTPDYLINTHAEEKQDVVDKKCIT